MTLRAVRFLLLPLVVGLAVVLTGCGGSSPSPTPGGGGEPAPQTPIQHVIIVVGENHSFDNLFATYQPSDPSQHVWNLLSRQIVDANGDPGPNFSQAAQQQATDTDQDGYLISPPQTGPFPTLPQPSTGVEPLLLSPREQYMIASDPGLATSDQDLLDDGGVLKIQPIQYPWAADTRFPTDLPNGPFPITQYGREIDTVGDPMHRFYQMWQQIDCSAAQISSDNPSGCLHDLYPWTAVTVGWGGTSENTPPPDPLYTFQGAVSMGFYNMAAGDVPYLKSLANTYAISDNYHQPMLGGTGPNSIFIGTGAPLVYSDASGNLATPVASQIENPNAYPGSNNWYRQDGFFIGNGGNESNGSYTNCSDANQPGVASILQYLDALPYAPFNRGNCARGAYHLVNNQEPSYDRNGMLFADQTYNVGPSSLPTIGDALAAAGVSWRYYGEGFSSSGLGGVYSHYCDICNPFQYAKSIMTTDLKNNIKDITDFFNDLQAESLPSVSIIKPDDIVDSHPGTSLPILYEAFVRNIVQSVQAHSAVWQKTAIFITFDESGGYYDSGYIQPIDFFGDGPRIPMIVVSPYAKPGYVDHDYGDHASLLKFIEKNWALRPLSASSRDNLPNPVSSPAAPYFPTNSPAVGDLMTVFQFSK